MKPVGIGIVGGGNISSQYLTAVKVFPMLSLVGIADLNRDAADARGAEFGVPAKKASRRCSPIPPSRSWSTSLFHWRTSKSA